MREISLFAAGRNKNPAPFTMSVLTTVQRYENRPRAIKQHSATVPPFAILFLVLSGSGRGWLGPGLTLKRHSACAQRRPPTRWASPFPASATGRRAARGNPARAPRHRATVP